MTDGTNAAPAASDAPLTLREAVGLLGNPQEREQQEPAAAEPSAPQTESSQEEPAAADDDQPPGDDNADQGEDAADDEPPPIQPPRSWSKAEKEAFASLPRDTQQMLADRERERETYYRKGHDEAAKKLKDAEAREQAAEQARQQYEQALPALQQQFEAQFNAAFSDIKTWDDVKAMRTNDPMRFMEWQEAREKGRALAQEAATAQQRQAASFQNNLKAYADEQDRLFVEKAPEFADPEKAPQLINEVRSMFESVGFDADELNALYFGAKPMNLRDHRFQLIVRDAIRFRAAEKAKAKAVVKPVPPVQRPGTPTSKAERASAEVQALDTRLSKSGSLKDAVALLNARSKARRA